MDVGKGDAAQFQGQSSATVPGCQHCHACVVLGVQKAVFFLLKTYNQTIVFPYGKKTLEKNYLPPS